MSKHIFKTNTKDNTKVCVTMGYDRPMNCFYLDIENMDSITDEVLYESYTDENSPYKLSLGYFIELLKSRYKIVLPGSMLKDVMSDKEKNVGNKIVVHQ